MEWLLLGAAALAGLAFVRGQRHRMRERELEAADLALVRRTVEEDVTALGEELRQLDSDTADQDLDEGSRRDFQLALDGYDLAKDAAATLSRPEDARRVADKLADGRFAMTCVRARLAGEPLPERRPPCFFDPGHGPSVREVRWAPSGGTMRDVPACAADARRVRDGVEPDSRKVLVGTRLVPYWRAGPAFRPLATGYFGTDSAYLFAGTAVVTAAVIGHGLDGSAGGHGGDVGYGDFGYGGDFGGAGDGGGGF